MLVHQSAPSNYYAKTQLIVCQERAGDWINALGLKLRSTEFITAIKYRLDLPIFRLQVGGVCFHDQAERRQERR